MREIMRHYAVIFSPPEHQLRPLSPVAAAHDTPLRVRKFPNSDVPGALVRCSCPPGKVRCWGDLGISQMLQTQKLIAPLRKVRWLLTSRYRRRSGLVSTRLLSRRKWRATAAMCRRFCLPNSFICDILGGQNALKDV